MIRNLIYIITLLLGIYSCGQKHINHIEQKKTYQIWTLEELLKSGETKGISQIYECTDPINLIFFDSDLSKKLIDMEFNSGWCEQLQDSAGIYRFRIPKITISIAEGLNDPYAFEKLFDYYKSLPKFIKSDTIYDIYGDLNEFLSLLVHDNPRGLKEVLRKDYYEWQKIALQAPKKKYPDIEELKSISLMERLKLKESDLYPDCNFILFQLAHALKYLGEPGFDSNLIAKLQDNQTYPFMNSYKFPNYIYYGPNSEDRITTTLKTPKFYRDFGELINDSTVFEKTFLRGKSDRQGEKIDKVIYNRSNKAYVETSNLWGEDGYGIILIGDSMVIENLWMLEF